VSQHLHLFAPIKPKTPIEAATTTEINDASTSSTDPIDGSSAAALKRSSLFNRHVSSLKSRLGYSPSMMHNVVRSKNYLTMMQFAKNAEDMSKVVDLIPKFCEGGGRLPICFGEEFVREWYKGHICRLFVRLPWVVLVVDEFCRRVVQGPRPGGA
jgi:hypothetical protein